MSPFGDDPFDGIFRQFFGGRGMRSGGSTSDNAEILDTVQTRKGTYFVFDFSNKKVTSVKVVDEVEENDYGEKVHTGRKMLEVRFGDTDSSRYVLPKNFKRNKLDWNVSNGILEVYLER